MREHDPARHRYREWPNHHGYSVSVKDKHRTYDEDDCEYELACERFWERAEELAREHGFEGVHQQGRMGGWLVVNPQPSTDDMWTYEVEEWERDVFGPFALDIKRLLKD